MAVSLAELNDQVKNADYSMLSELNEVLKKHGVQGYIHNFMFSPQEPEKTSHEQGIDPQKCSFCCWSAGPQLLGCGLCCDW